MVIARVKAPDRIPQPAPSILGSHAVSLLSKAESQVRLPAKCRIGGGSQLDRQSLQGCALL